MGVMYKEVVIHVLKTSLVLYLLFLFGCIAKPPVLKKYGWNLVDEKNIPANFIEDELCHSPEGYFDESVWYISNKKDYLICNKPSFFEDFCIGYHICYNMNEYYDCGFVVPFQGWKYDLEKDRRPDKKSKEERAENDKLTKELLGIKSCEEKKIEKLKDG